MKTQIAIDKAGRVVLPKAIRDRLQLGPGDLLDVSLEDDEVKLHPVRNGGRMVKKGDIWVYRTGGPVDPEEIDSYIKLVREERDFKLWAGQE